MNKMRHLNSKGSLLAFAAVAAVVLALMVIFISNIFRSSSRQTNYLSTMKKMDSIAQEGASHAISKLMFDPDACIDPSFDDPTTSPTGGIYQNTCQRRDSPLAGVFYVVTSATLTANGQFFHETLHTYAGISNVSVYFAAVNGLFTVGSGSDITGGRIYAVDLKFGTGSGNTLVDRAEYVNAITPPAGSWPNPPGVTILGTPNIPVQLSAPLLFPRLTKPDLDQYRYWAGTHTVCNVFNWDHIYPPGYSRFAYVGNINESGDNYKLSSGFRDHTSNQTQHIYFSTDDIHIGKVNGGTVTIHGQVLFVSEKRIILHGNILVANETTFPNQLNLLKQTGPSTYNEVSSSTAHQGVYICGTGQDVVISTGGWNGVEDHQIQSIQGLVFAPTGTFLATPYAVILPGPVAPGDKMNLDFLGGMILGSDVNMREVFLDTQPGRRYRYLMSLRDNPPPFMPALQVIYNQLIDS